MARFSTTDRSIDVVIARHLSPEARAAKLAAFAKDRLAEAQTAHRAARGTVPLHETIVDRQRGAPVDSVRPDGEIVFEFELIRTVLISIADMLDKASPVLTGQYRRSHVLFADGQETDPASAPAVAAEFAFVNIAPYARRLEAGISKAAPEGVYQAVADTAARRFGNVARIRFTFRSAVIGPVFGAANRAERQAMRSQPARRAAIRLERATRSPSIIVVPR